MADGYPSIAKAKPIIFFFFFISVGNGPAKLPLKKSCRPLRAGEVDENPSGHVSWYPSQMFWWAFWCLWWAPPLEPVAKEEMILIPLAFVMAANNRRADHVLFWPYLILALHHWSLCTVMMSWNCFDWWLESLIWKCLNMDGKWSHPSIFGSG